MKYSKETGDGRVENQQFYLNHLLDNKDASVFVTDLEILDGFLNFKLIRMSDNPEIFRSTLARDFCLQFSAPRRPNDNSPNRSSGCGWRGGGRWPHDSRLGPMLVGADLVVDVPRL